MSVYGRVLKCMCVFCGGWWRKYFRKLLTLIFSFCFLCLVRVHMCVWAGKPVWRESGELVCLKPIPCQPTHFWNDENGSKYHKAYFSTYPGKYQTSVSNPNMHTLYKIKHKDTLFNVHNKIPNVNMVILFLLGFFLILHIQLVLFLMRSFSVGVWAHGDYCKINPKTGGIVMLGRRSAINHSTQSYHSNLNRHIHLEYSASGQT